MLCTLIIESMRLGAAKMKGSYIHPHARGNMVSRRVPDETRTWESVCLAASFALIVPHHT